MKLFFYGKKIIRTFCRLYFKREGGRTAKKKFYNEAIMPYMKRVFKNIAHHIDVKIQIIALYIERLMSEL
ncbi:MAG: hypothetical protein LBI60_01570 [Bacteroidales bacterium]|jgi:hypothetical protein|nr:hypothetical protein [Bacteroidales bacterium]